MLLGSVDLIDSYTKLLVGEVGRSKGYMIMYLGPVDPFKGYIKLLLEQISLSKEYIDPS